MKVYIGAKKVNGKWMQGITIYSDANTLPETSVKSTTVGVVLYSDSAILRNSGVNKFDKDLEALIWGIRKLKVLGQSKKISETEKVLLFVEGKTLLTWFEKETAPLIYISKFSELLLEMSFVVNDIEIIQSGQPKIIFTKREELVKVTDLFK